MSLPLHTNKERMRRIFAKRDEASGGRASRNESSGPRAGRGEEGSTLVEVLISIIIIGLAGSALMTGFAGVIAGSADHRSLATFDTLVVDASQQAISGIQQQSALFTTCPTNPVTYYQTNVPLTIPEPDTANYSAAVTGVLYWNGTAFTSSCTPNNPEPQEITVTVTHTGAGPGPTSYSNTFDITYPLAPASTATGVASKMVFSTEPGNGSGGIALATQPQVTIEDASGDPVSTDLSPVTLAITSNSSTIAGCSGSELDGVVTFSGCAVLTAGTYTMTASDGSLPTVQSTSFTISSAPPSLVFTQQPVAGASASTLSTQPIIKVETSGGAVVTSSTATITLTSSAGTLTGCANLTAVSGVINVSGCKFAGLVGTYYTISASSSNLVGGTSNSISPSGPGPATQILFTTDTTGAASSSATAAFTTQPVVTAEDSAGNIATGYSTAITLSSSASTLTCSPHDYVTPSSGVATYSGCHLGAYENGVTLTATSGTLTATSTSFNVTGVPAKLVFSTQPVSVVSGASFTTQPVIEIEDANNSVVTSDSGTISLTASAGTLSLCSGLTTTTGVFSVASCTFAGLAGTPYTLTASLSGLTVTSASFSPSSPGPAAQLVYTTQPVAGASQSALTTQPVIKVEDSGGNVVTSSSATVSLASSGGTLAGCTNLTAVAGVINVATCTFAGVIGSSYTITASASSLSATTSATLSPTGPGPASQVLLTGCSTGVVYASTCTITATMVDTYNNTVTSYTGNITFAEASGTGTLGGLTAVAAVSGAAPLTVSGTGVGPLQVTATSDSPAFTSLPLSLTVTPEILTASVTASNKTYDGTTAATVTSCTLSPAPAGVTCSASAATFSQSNVGNSLTVTATGITLSGTGSTNYTLASQSATTTASIATTPLVVTASSPTLTYGSSVPTITATYSGFVSGQSASNLTAQPTCTTAYTTSSAVGTTPATSCSGAVDANYTITYVAGTVTVNKATLTITATNTTNTYGTAPASPTATYSGFVNGQNASNLTTAPTCSTTVTASFGAGSYVGASTCSGAVDPNYTIIYVAGNATVNKATLTITASGGTEVYGSSAPTVTASYSGFVNGDGVSSLTSTPTCVSNTSATSTVGSYASSCSGAASANYAFTYVAGTITVTKAPLTITASSTTLTYGSATPTITASYSGFVNSQSASNLTTQPTCVTAYTNNSLAGTTPSTSCSGATSANYAFTYVAGTVTVTQAPLTITASSTTRTYGSSIPTITATYSGFTSGDTASNLTTQPTCTTTYTSDSFANTTPSTSCSGAVDPNYTITYVAGSVTVTQAALQITASSTTLTYGSAVPTITATYSGFTSGDTASNLTTQPTCTTAYTVTSGAGTTPSTSCSGAVDPNYTITYVAGTVTVNKIALTATVTIQNKTYNGSTAAAVTACSLSGSTGLTCVYSGATATFASANVGNGISVNVTGLTLSGTGSGNYTITTPVTGSANITQATPTITFNSSNVSGSAPNQTASSDNSTHYTLSASSSGTGTVTYSVTSQGSTGCTLSGSTLTFTRTGTCTITASVTANGNYAAASSTLTIDVRST